MQALLALYGSDMHEFSVNITVQMRVDTNFKCVNLSLD